MATLADFARLKAEVAEAEEQAARARGALDELMGRLQNEFGCKTLEEGERMLKRLQQEAVNKQEEFDKALKTFKAKYAKELE